MTCPHARVHDYGHAQGRVRVRYRGHVKRKHTWYHSRRVFRLRVSRLVVCDDVCPGVCVSVSVCVRGKSTMAPKIGLYFTCGMRTTRRFGDGGDGRAKAVEAVDAEVICVGQQVLPKVGLGVCRFVINRGTFVRGRCQWRRDQVVTGGEV